MAEKSVKGKQGKRYSAEQKAEMMQFISDYNAKNKRGGMKTASDKYGVSVVTLSNWAKQNKSPKKRKVKAKTAVKKVVVKKKGRKKIAKASPAAPAVESPDAILKRLQAIRAEVNALEKEYNSLKKKL